jgi:hypothetical protein
MIPKWVELGKYPERTDKIGRERSPAPLKNLGVAANGEEDA